MRNRYPITATVRLSAAQKARIHRVAVRHDKGGVSGWMRRLILAECDRLESPARPAKK